MSDLEQIREEIDDLRGRVTVLEFDFARVNSTSSSARTAARAADRQLAKSQSEWREVVADLEAGMNQIISLLSASATFRPARRPENTQSASDKPLT